MLFVVLAFLFSQALLVYWRGILPRTEPSLMRWLMPALIGLAAVWALFAAWRAFRRAASIEDDS